MPARNYSSTVTAKTLTAITSTTLTVNPDLSSLPQDYPYTLVINPDTSLEEIVTVRSLNGGTVLNITRGQDGTGQPSHSAGAVIKHMITPRDMQEPQNHIEAASSYTIKNDGTDVGVTGPTISKSLHGIASGEGSVVGTDKTQVLKNKTLSGTGAGANTFTSIPQASITNLTTDLGLKAPLASPTFTGTVVLPSTTSIGNVSSSELGVLDGVTASTAEINILDGVTSSTAELNILDGVTATAAEINHVVGVTGPIQTQFTNQTTALTTHAGVTGSVHGIADTTKLAKFGSAAAGRTIFVQTTTPTALATGDIWIDY